MKVKVKIYVVELKIATEVLYKPQSEMFSINFQLTRGNLEDGNKEKLQQRRVSRLRH
jgi:hypothetical protein